MTGQAGQIISMEATAELQPGGGEVIVSAGACAHMKRLTAHSQEYMADKTLAVVEQLSLDITRWSHQVTKKQQSRQFSIFVSAIHENEWYMGTATSDGVKED